MHAAMQTNYATVVFLFFLAVLCQALLLPLQRMKEFVHLSIESFLKRPNPIEMRLLRRSRIRAKLRLLSSFGSWLLQATGFMSIWLPESS